MTISRAATFSFQAQLKRMADVVVAVALLLFTSPLIGVAALFIWLEDRGPVFYSQRRSGWLGREFTLFKLRTMLVQPLDSPPEWTQPGDQRITKIGSLLRRVRLDELPQLFNVINGEMSLIGPRPERPELEHRLSRASSLSKASLDASRFELLGTGMCSLCQHIEESDLKLSLDLSMFKKL